MKAIHGCPQMASRRQGGPWPAETLRGECDATGLGERESGAHSVIIPQIGADPGRLGM
jgi:hypothetical protein